MNLSDAIERKPAEIYDGIKQNIIATPDYGLLSGLGGKTLFPDHYEKYNPNKGNGSSVSAPDHLRISISQYKGVPLFAQALRGLAMC